MSLTSLPSSAWTPRLAVRTGTCSRSGPCEPGRATVTQMEGSADVAVIVARCRPEVICAYPISPQTHIVEALSREVKSGRLAPCEFINTESEFAAMSAAIGASAAGAPAYTATASHGLLYPRPSPRYVPRSRQAATGSRAHPRVSGRVRGAVRRSSGGRLIQQYRTTDAEKIVVALGSVLGRIKDTIDGLRGDGMKIGALGISSFRTPGQEANLPCSSMLCAARWRFRADPLRRSTPGPG